MTGNIPRPYDLTTAVEMQRLHREVLGYLKACQKEHHGTDFKGREYAIAALEEVVNEIEFELLEPEIPETWEPDPEPKERGCVCLSCFKVEAGSPPPGWKLSDPEPESGSQHWLCPECQKSNPVVNCG